MNTALQSTRFNLPGQKHRYQGKVRDVYHINDHLLVMVVTDRISAFDHVLPRGIPGKGQILNTVAARFLEATRDICPNWVMAVPDPNVTVGRRCIPYKVEMVIRGYLSGHAWREYRAGQRVLCGEPMPEGMRESDPFPAPLITPSTKADEGHDEDISRGEILKQGIVSEEEYCQLEAYTRALFQKGSEMAGERGLILVDTKYEFGKTEDGEIILIDEIHTPDSSRYFYSDGYADRQAQGEPQKQLSKEFVRQWLIEHGFQGLEGQQMPKMPDAFVNEVTERYTELFEKMTGTAFMLASDDDIEKRVEQNILSYLEKNA